jgi:DNA replication ATP-dependent helicase Dna2
MASRDRLNRSHTNVPRPQHGYTNVCGLFSCPGCIGADLLTTRLQNSRSRPFQNNRSLSAASLPPSTTTKRKLKAFQFIDGAPSDSLFAEENKENIEILAPVEKALDGEIRPPQISADPLAIPQQPNLAVPLSPNNPQKEFPSTPLNSSKLPLTHLIGRTPIDKPGAGDAAKREGLSWKQQTPRASQPAVTPARKRKRAQSSSPPIDGPPNRVFKTPMQDPASELWMRYRGDSNSKESALKASQSGLEKLLLVDSSPRSAATAGSVGGLRRYSSCGYQWPTSRKKRRQTRPVLSAYLPEPDAVDVSGHRTSKVSLLLEEATWLKETERQIFDDDEDQPRAPSSSSPLPLAGRSMDDAIDDESPSRKGAPTDILGRAPNPAKEAPPQQVDVQEDASLEFDNFDADFDEEAGDLHQLLASTAAMLDGGQIPADRSPDGQQMDVTMPDFQEAAAKKVVDEFDDGALSDGEWEFAATLANSNVDAAKNVANVQETSEAILLPSSGYGGDSDDLQAFDAVDGGVQQKSQRERVCLVCLPSSNSYAN